MREIGITRSIDKLGRLVIPTDWRSTLGITTTTELEITCQSGTIIIRKAGCHLCGDTDCKFVQGVRLCKHCIQKIADAR